MMDKNKTAALFARIAQAVFPSATCPQTGEENTSTLIVMTSSWLEMATPYALEPAPGQAACPAFIRRLTRTRRQRVS